MTSLTARQKICARTAQHQRPPATGNRQPATGSGRGAGAGVPVDTSALIAPPMDPPSACLADPGLQHANLVGYISFG